MNARYRETTATVEPDTRRLTLSFHLENRSSSRWSSQDGFHLGWQLYDPDTEVFIAEGRWMPLPADLGPGQSAWQSLEVELPPERGRYHVYVSPLHPHHGWFYARGGRFLLVSASVAAGRAELLEVRETTLAGLRRLKRLRSLSKAVVWPVRSIWKNRGLIRSMVRRDIAARYRGSLGDALWAVLNPALLMLTYFFVFGIVLRARFAGDPSRLGFALYFLAGMLPWLAFSEAAGRAPGVIIEHRNFVKKLVFPIEILPVNLTIAGLVTQALAIAVFFVFLLAARGAIPLTALWLPVLIVPQLLFTLGIAWFLAALGVYVRDLGQLIGYLLTLWFFLTPICYPEASLPAEFLPVLAKNPLYVLVRGFRDVLLESRPPDWSPVGRLWLLSALVFVAGHAWFYKLRKSFADVI